MKKYFVLIAMVCCILFSCKPDPTLPTVTTLRVDKITDTTALCVGDIKDSGNADITAEGFCWSTNQEPTLNDNFVNLYKRNSPVPPFESTITGLTANTTYYVRAYVTNEVGTAYGEELSFTTLESNDDNDGDDDNGDDDNGDDDGNDDGNGDEIEIVIPTVNTLSPCCISFDSATLGGEVIADGGAEVTSRGFYWNEADVEFEGEIPADDNKVEVGSGNGPFNYTLYGLKDGTRYRVMAFATNEAGTAYGEIVNFVTEKNGNGGDDDDNDIEYPYVDLGLPSGVKWAEYNIGANRPEGYGDHFAWGEIELKETYESGNCSSYYQDLGDISGNPQYDAAAAIWGDGWRMPTLEEMYELTTECTWTWTDVNGTSGYKVISKTNGNHIFLPASGFRVNGDLLDRDAFGYYWMSTPYDEEEGSTFTKATFLDMCSYQFYCNWSLRRNGMTIRPVRD